MRGSAAWMVLPAAAMAVSLGVALDVGLGIAVDMATTTPVNAAATITSGTGATLSNAGYAGATYFFLPYGFSITNGGVTGPSGHTWTLINQGSIGNGGTNSNGVYLSTGTVSNGGSYASHPATSAAYIGFAVNGVSIANAGSVYNFGTIKGVTQTGVYIAGLGTLTNKGLVSGGSRGAWLNGGGSLDNSGTITSTAGNGAVLFSAAGTVTNSGAITGGGTYGVSLAAGGSVTNSGTITGNGDGVTIVGGLGVVINYGSIHGATLQGVYLGAGGSVGNYGTITSARTAGVYLKTGGTLTNGTSTMTASSVYGLRYGVKSAAGAFITNYGTIQSANSNTGFNEIGIMLENGGTVINAGTLSRIGGFTAGIEIQNAAGFVTNYGSINNSVSGYNIGVLLSDGGTVTNGGTASSIMGANSGVKITGAAGVVINSGSINGATLQGIYLGAGGNVTNNNAGVILGGVYGVKVTTSAGTITNYGTIESANSNTLTNPVGVMLGGGSTLINESSGLISGYHAGVSLGNFSLFSNYGTINGFGSGHNIGVVIGSGTVVNGSSLVAGALIVGQAYGVEQGSGQLGNWGTITSPQGVGVYLEPGSNLDNYRSGAIYGRAAGVKVSGGFQTITNSGTISSGTGYGIHFTSSGSYTVINSGTIAGGAGKAAILFGSGSDLLVLEAGYSFTGAVDGAGGTNTLEFQSGGGTLANVGTEFLNFQRVTIDAGNSLANGGAATIATLTDQGSLTNTGTLTLTGALDDNGILINPGTINGRVNLGSGISFNNSGLAANGTQTAVYAGSPATLTNSGTINGGTLTGGGFLYFAVEFFGGGVIANSGTIAGYSAVDAHGVTVTNTGLIQGTGTEGEGVYVSAGLLSNSGTIEGGVLAKAAGTVVNAAFISGGVSLAGGSTLINGSSLSAAALIDGSISANSAGDSIVNYGTMAQGLVGLFRGGQITNKGTISEEILATAAGGTILNQGVIAASASTSGVVIAHGGTVSNSAAGSISGYSGVAILGASGTVINAGTIKANVRYGIRFLDSSGTFNNSVTNSGAIIGAPGKDAVLFGAGNDRLILGAGYSFTGAVDGGSGTNTLEFASGTATLSSLGSAFLNFQDVQLDPGASFVPIAGGTIASGITLSNVGSIANIAGYTIAGVFDNGGTFINSGSLDVTGTFANSGTFNNSGIVTAAYAVGGFGAIINSGTIIAGSGYGVVVTTLTNSGLIQGAAGGVTGHGVILNTGTILSQTGAGVSLYGSVTNKGLIQGASFGVLGYGDITNSGTVIATNGPGIEMIFAGTLTNTGLIQGTPYGLVAGAGATITNSGTIVDAGMAGASLGSGAVLTNEAGGLITGVTGVGFTGTGATLVNYGVITGTGGTAVQFDAGSNTLTLGTGSVLSGTIEGGGGAGQINLAGTGTIANSISNFGAGSALTIAKGASWTVTGPATVASLVNNGTFTPGSAGAPLKLTGNFAQSATGVFEALLNEDGAAAGLQVTGTATLAGTVLVTPTTVPSAATTYTILTATGGVTGTFSSVSDGSVLLRSTVSYDANDVFVTSTPLSSTRNEFAVGTGFDAANKANPALFGPAAAALGTLQAPALRAALDRLAGENNADLSTVALTTGRQFIRQFQNHALTHGPDDHGGDIWASGFGQSGNVDGDANSHRLNEGSAGGAIGAETEAAPHLNLGLMLGYGVGHFDVAGGLGEGRMNYTEFALTGDYTSGPFTLTAILGGLEGRGTTLRDVSVPGTAATARGKVSDRQILGAVETGYRMDDSWGVNLTPFLGLNFGAVKEDSLTETGGGALDLSASSRSTASVQSELGARLSEDMSLGGLPLSTDVKLAWGHDFAGTARQAQLSFAGGTDFLVSGARAPTDSAVIGLGLAARIWREGAITLHYDGDFAGRAQSNAVSLGLRIAW